MRFKIDENLPVEVAELLIDAGHDARTVNDQHMQGAKDPTLINACKAEDRALVTLDKDFSDIRAYPPHEFAGIIVLRPGSQAKRHVLKVFKRTVPLIGVEPLSRHLWVVEETVVRVRGKDRGMSG